ncbi:hypothetical protein Nmel_002870 [Mimus melanotis]
MEQYFSATQKMEQEVMFPSLLRGVFPQQEGAAPAAESRTDLYERYQLLKAIKPMVEKGLASVGDQSPTGADTDVDASSDSGEAEDAQLEERLSHHLTGLQQVLTHLTRDTNALTRRYSQILEQINLSEGQPSWCWCQEAQDVPVADHRRLFPVTPAFPTPWQLITGTDTGDGCDHWRSRWCLILIGRSIWLCREVHWKNCTLVPSSLFSKSGAKSGVL